MNASRSPMPSKLVSHLNTCKSLSVVGIFKSMFSATYHLFYIKTAFLSGISNRRSVLSALFHVSDAIKR